MFEQRWLLYAALSALSAAFVGVFGKLGMQGIDSTLATVVRSVVMTLFLLAAAVMLGTTTKLNTLHPKAVVAIVLSGVAGPCRGCSTSRPSKLARCRRSPRSTK